MKMRTKFYLLSMWLFFIIVIILSFPEKESEWYLCILPGLSFLALLYVSVFFLTLFVNKKRDSAELAVKIIEVDDRSYDTLAFLAAYFIPLVSFEFNDFRHHVVLAILFVAIGVIYSQCGLYYANPSLALLGLRTYSGKIHFQNGDEMDNVVIVSHDRLRVNDNIVYFKIEESVFFAKVLN